MNEAIVPADTASLRDLKNIARYTRQQWGEIQRERYMRALDERFRWLTESNHEQASIDLMSPRATTAFHRLRM